MSLDSILTVSAGGLANVSRQLAVISQNVSNASTPGYAREVGSQSSLTAGGVGQGVRTGPVTRDIDTALQGQVLAQSGAIAGLQTRQTALQRIDAVLGTVGSGDDVPSALGRVQDAFTTLVGSPENAADQAAVVDAARTLTGRLNTIAATVQATRQAAQDQIVRDVGALGDQLGQLGQLGAQIVSQRQQGLETADLENQRDAVRNSLSQLVDVRFLDQPNGDVLAVSAGGVVLPTRAGAAPVTTQAAALGPSSTHPASAYSGGVPAITLNGADITSLLTGGSIGAAVTLRDITLPTLSANLDEFAQTLSTRFDAQGLTLFSRADGTVPVAAGPPAQAGYVGYAATVTVNPTVAADTTTVRDGTHDVASGPGAAFTRNPAGGPAGFTGLIQRVLDYAFGSEAQAGVTQPAPATAGLGASGTLSAGFATPATLADYATAVVGAHAAASGQASAHLTTEEAVQTTLRSRLSDRSGVNIDAELSTLVQLQNAYGANAKVFTASQSLWTQLLQIVP